jgi:hypothetical protein
MLLSLVQYLSLFSRYIYLFIYIYVCILAPKNKRMHNKFILFLQ